MEYHSELLVVDNFVTCENIVKTEDTPELEEPGCSRAQECVIVKARQNICLCCLSENVPFVKVANCKHVEFFNCNLKLNFKLRYPDALVCHVCHGMLKKIYQFKRQVESSLLKLNDQLNRPKSNNIKFSKLEQSNIEIFHTLNSKPIEQEIIRPLQTTIEVKVEEYSDPENEVPLSEIKEKKVKTKPLLKTSGLTVNFDKYEGKLRCIILSELEMLNERMVDASKEQFLKLMFRCEDCIVGFDHEVTLKEHMQQRHEANGEFKCTICKSVLSTVGSYKDHMRRHYRRIECVACGARYSTVDSAVTHYSKLHGVLQTYQCTECQFTTTSYRRYRYHRDRHKQRIPCDLCESSFVNNSGLKAHVLTVHKISDRVYTCSECPKTYRSRSGLLGHASAHGSRGAYCAPCRTHFRTEAGLKRHLRVHSSHSREKDKRHVCALCEERFMTKGQLKDHLDWDHLKNIKHKCNECNKPFKTNSRLKKHMNYVHEKQRPPRNKMCDHCGRGFTTMAILSSHIRTHTGERPHACARCGATFAHSAALYTHNKLLHAGEKKST